MPKQNVYLPQDLLDGLRQRPEIKISTVCQAALRKALDPDITTEALTRTVEESVAEQADVILRPHRVTYADRDTLALTLDNLAAEEIVSVTHDGVSHVIVWREV